MTEKKWEGLMLLRKEEGEKRVVYVFAHPEKEGREVKVSAFPPTKEGDLELPNFKHGIPYDIVEDQVPMGGVGNEGKFYHNLAKNGKKYRYQESKPDFTDPTEAKAEQAQGQKPAQAQKPYMNSDQYYRNKEEREIMKDPKIFRLSCISSASEMVSRMVMPDKMSREDVAELTIWLADRFFQYAEGKLLAPPSHIPQPQKPEKKTEIKEG